MNNNDKKETVKDGFFSDLPKDLQDKLKKINKLIIDIVDKCIKDDKYKDIRDSKEAMKNIEAFKNTPEEKGHTGSFRIFNKNGKKECMIQISGHFMNPQNTDIEKLLHQLICEVSDEVTPIVKDTYNMRIDNEAPAGASEEGIDVYPPNSEAEELWKKFDDNTEKEIKESVYTEAAKRGKAKDGYFADLPNDIASKVQDCHRMIVRNIENLIRKSSYQDLVDSDWAMGCIDKLKAAPDNKGDVGSFRVWKYGSGYKCEIQITDSFRNHQSGWIESLLNDFVNDAYDYIKGKIRQKYDMGLINKGKGGDVYEYYTLSLSKKDAERMWNLVEDARIKNIKESADPVKPEDNDDYDAAYNKADLTEKQARATLRTLSQDIMNHYEDGEVGKGKNKVSQYTANIYANIITKNLLSKWAPGYKKFSITLDSYQSFNTLEFKIPTMSQDFISRFIEGREPLNAFLHRIPEIKIKMSPRIFHTMKTPDDAFNFFRAALTYYSSKVDRYSHSLFAEIFKLNHSMKHLIGTTKLSGLVTYPIQILFVFNDVQMDNRDTFKIDKSDISAVNQFVHNIYKSYAAPEKEKKKIVEDMKSMIKELKEACDIDENIQDLILFPEAVNDYLFGKYDKNIAKADQAWINENVDVKGMQENKDKQAKVLYEKFGVKKLKKIPMDTIAYIQIEAESIKDSNDKMMIASYCCGKIELVEWYIELIDVGSSKYIVPHNRQYLENMRTQLLACYKKIMATPIPKADRPIISVQYPKGYEG